MATVKSAVVELIDSRGWFWVRVIYSDKTTTCIAQDERGKWFKENSNLAQEFADRYINRSFASRESSFDANPYVY
jgi:hypothetical protein